MSGNLYLVWVTFPVQILIGTSLLYELLGLSGVLGVVLMMALLPLNILVSKRLAAVQSQLLHASDARIQSDNEMLGAIRIIKYYAWDAPFRERVLRYISFLYQFMASAPKVHIQAMFEQYGPFSFLFVDISSPHCLH